MSGVLCIQIQPVVGDKELNIKKIEGFIKRNSDKKPDLVVLPEFFSTGISHDCFLNMPEDENGGETIGKISDIAKKYDTNIVAGTVIEKSDGKLYNTSFVIKRNGQIAAKYRKIHLFKYLGGTEDEIITTGNEIKTVDLDFGKIGLAICYDIRYPRHFQTLAREKADIIVLPTAWCISNEVYNNSMALKTAQDMWLAMNRVRAYDNQVYVVSCNQTGKNNERVSSIGNSAIISPTAEIMANAGDKECAVYAQPDLDGAKYYKSLCPIAFED